MALATLTIDLVAQLASLQEGMDKAGRLAEKQANEIESRYARLTSVARAAGAAIGGAISVAGLVSFFRATVNGLDALNDLKDATGASIENISALEDVAARTGTSFETVASGLVKFNKVLNEAEPDSKMERTLRAIGLSAEELRQMDPSQALLKTAQAIDTYADSGNKARIIQDFFGKSTREFAPFLKDLAEKGQLVATVTSQQADEAERFNKALFNFSKNSQDAGRAIVSNLLPSINELISRYQTANSLFGGLGATLAKGVTEKLNFSNPADGLREYNAQIAALDQKLKDIASGKGGFGFTELTINNRRKALEAERGELAKVAEYYRTLVNAGSAGAGRGSQGPKPDAPIIPDKRAKPPDEEDKKLKIDDNTRALAQYVEQLQKQIDKTVDLTERQKALDMLRSIGITGDVPQVREVVLGLADELDLREKSLGFAKSMTAEMERQRNEQEGLDTELARFAGRLEDARKQALTARLESRLAAGDVFSPEELDRIVKGIGGVKDQMAELDEFTKQFSNNIQDALGNTLEKTLSGNFSSIASMWGNMLLKMATQAVAADLTRALFPGIKGGAGSGTSAVGGLLTAFGGLFGGLFGGIGSLFGGGRATGGGVRSGRIYSVVENGPELLQMGNRTMLLMGKQGGQVVPAQAGSAGGGSTTVVVHQAITFAVGVSRNEMAAQAQIIKAQAVAAVYEAMRRGRSPQDA